MTTFKEIDINEYKKLLDNMQHTYAKTFNNIELLNYYIISKKMRIIKTLILLLKTRNHYKKKIIILKNEVIRFQIKFPILTL